MHGDRCLSGLACHKKAGSPFSVADSGVTAPCCTCAEDAECFLSTSNLSFLCGFPQELESQPLPAAGSRAKQEGGIGEFLFPELIVTLLFRSIPGKHILRLLLALPEPAAAEPSQLPRPLHRQPGACTPRSVRTARPQGAMVQ